MDTQSRQWNWRFVGLWVLTGTLGTIAFGLAAFASMWGLGSLVEDTAGEALGFAVAGAAFGALLAAGLSLGPGWLLRSQDIPLRRWVGWSVLAGALGMAITFFALFSIFDASNMPETVAGLVMGITLGLSLGLGQWRALGPRANAGLWPAIVVVALVAALTVGLSLSGEGREWLSLGAVGLLASTGTGLGMGWLLAPRRHAAAV